MHSYKCPENFCVYLSDQRTNGTVNKSSEDKTQDHNSVEI